MIARNEVVKVVVISATAEMTRVILAFGAAIGRVLTTTVVVRRIVIAIVAVVMDVVVEEIVVEVGIASAVIWEKQLRFCWLSSS